MTHPKTFSVIGAGRVGKALSVALLKKGWACQSVISRRVSSATELARILNNPPAATDLRELVGAQWVFVCCPDDVLPAIANSLARLPLAWKDLVVAHTSGSVGSEVFSAVAREGALTCSIHPAISLSGAANDWQKISTATFGIEGKEDALVQARALLAELGANVVHIPAGGKVGYHLACVLVSNYLVTLHALALQVAAGAIGGSKMLQRLLVELSQDTLANLSTQPPATALTGPIARGDTGTVTAHIEFLKKNFPHLLDLYLSLGKETLACARSTMHHAPIWQELERLFHL